MNNGKSECVADQVAKLVLKKEFKYSVPRSWYLVSPLKKIAPMCATLVKTAKLLSTTLRAYCRAKSTANCKVMANETRITSPNNQ